MTAATPDPDAEFFLSAHAIIGSTRADALDPLDLNAPQDAAPARFWAEPALVAQAVDRLEALGFDVQRCDRMGVHIMGRAGDLAKAFEVRLWLDRTDPDKPLWRATDKTGADLDGRIPPTSKQLGWLRGVVLPQPTLEYDTLQDWENKADLLHYPYQTLPHQLRRELCATDPGSGPQATPPISGKGVKILVFDSGFDGRHPYWALAPHPTDPNPKRTLAEAASKVKVEEASAYRLDRDILAANLQIYLGELETCYDKLEKEQSNKSLKSLIDARRVPDATLALRKKYEQAGKFAADQAKLNKITSVSEFSDEFFSDKYIEELKIEADRVIKAYSDEIAGLKKRLPVEDYSVPHGTIVVGHLIAVAPEAEIIVVQRVANSVFQNHIPSNYINPSLIKDDVINHNPNLVSISQGTYCNASHLDDIVNRNRTQMAGYIELLKAAHDKKVLIFQAIGNISNFFYYENVPDAGSVYNETKRVDRAREEIDVSVAVEHYDSLRVADLMLVGGAYWSRRHDVKKPTRRVATASSFAVGFEKPSTALGKTGPIRGPHICGLCGPAFSKKSDVAKGGLGLAAIIKKSNQVNPNGSVNLVDTWGFASGTSYAAPQVCGVAALVIQKMGGVRNVPRLRKTLLDTSVKIDAGSFGRPSDTDDILKSTGPRPGLVALDRALDPGQSFQGASTAQNRLVSAVAAASGQATNSTGTLP